MDNIQNKEVEIRILDHGPMIVRGYFALTGPDGKTAEPTQQQIATGVALCRCGKSQEQPFCDGSHVKPQPHNPFLK